MIPYTKGEWVSMDHPPEQDMTGVAVIDMTKDWADRKVDGTVVRSCWMVASHIPMRTAVMWFLARGLMPANPGAVRAQFMVRAVASLHDGSWWVSFEPEWREPPCDLLPGWAVSVANNTLREGYTHTPEVLRWREEAKTNASHKRHVYLGRQRGPGTVVVMGGLPWVIVSGVGERIQPTAWRAVLAEGVETPGVGRTLAPVLKSGKLVWRTLEMAEVGAHSADTKNRLPLHPNWPQYHALIVDNPTRFGV